jgi:hypothetical protein
MMPKLRFPAGLLVAALALQPFAVTAADHHPTHDDHHEHRDRRDRHEHHDHDHGHDEGALAAVAGLILGSALVAGAGHHDSPPPIAPDAPPPPPPIAQADPVATADADTRAAIEACGASVEEEGRQDARLAHVSTVDSVDTTGAWMVIRGRVNLRDDLRQPGDDHAFTCSLSGEGVQDVHIEQLKLASQP